ncbi:MULTISPECIES: hypothetical protein [unclassified Kribbella]|uniref:hypothetical protein n=1 Tax=unclassified Kribbella TaxID=2644121 RepID=UPI0030190EEE
MFGDALHGEFVTAKDGGGYETIATQKGEVTAVSTTSITVKSADGYSRTYGQQQGQPEGSKPSASPTK